MALSVQSVAKAQSVLPIKKTDVEKQLVYGEVYAPTIPDSQGDFMSAETIEKMAHQFMRNGFVKKIDVNHTQQESGSCVVESFIARDDDPTFIPGAWVIGVHIPDAETWSLVKSGDLNGFSLDGIGIRVETTVKLDVPDRIVGRTLKNEDHDHEFFVTYDDEGNFLGGMTSPGPDGHVHRITRGTATEMAMGHSHRFSYVEGVAYAQD